MVAVERLDAGPLRSSSQFRWTTEGLTVTSTVRAARQDHRLLWGGPANGIEGHHLWTFADVEGGVLVHTEESWSGAPSTSTCRFQIVLRGASMRMSPRLITGAAVSIPAPSLEG